MTYLIHAVKHCGDLTGKYAGNSAKVWDTSRTKSGWNANHAFRLCEQIRKYHIGCGCVFEVVESEEQ